jgi:hypothetical protein
MAATYVYICMLNLLTSKDLVAKSEFFFENLKQYKFDIVTKVFIYWSGNDDCN